MAINVQNVERFKFIAHKIIPLVYDDSLSYYEFLCKVMQKLNEVISSLDYQNEVLKEFDEEILDWETSTDNKYNQFVSNINTLFEAFKQGEVAARTAFMDTIIGSYNASTPYAIGQYVRYGNNVYKCTTATSGEAWNPGHWTQVVYADDLSERQSNYEDSITAQQNAFETEINGKQTTFEQNITEFESSMQAQWDKFFDQYLKTLGVVQTTGTSTTDVMSQKAVTDKLNEKTDVGKVYGTEKQYIGEIVDGKWKNKDGSEYEVENAFYLMCDVTPATKYFVSGICLNSTFPLVIFYNDSTFIDTIYSADGQKDVNKEIVTPSGCNKMYINARKINSTSPTDKGIYPCAYYIKNVEYNITNLSTSINNKQTKLYNWIDDNSQNKQTDKFVNIRNYKTRINSGPSAEGYNYTKTEYNKSNVYRFWGSCIVSDIPFIIFADEFENVIGTYGITAKSYYQGVSVSIPAITKYIYVQGNGEREKSNIEIGIERNVTSLCSGKKAVFLGDSITQGLSVVNSTVLPHLDYPSVAGRLLDCDIYNGGLGGSTYSSDRSIDFRNVVGCIISGDYSTVLDGIDKYSIRESAKLQYAKIAELDFNNVDYIIISYGTNDWEFAATTNDVISAMSKGITDLLTAYPNLQVFILTPIFRFNIQGSGEDSDTFVNPNTNLKLPDMCEAIISCAKSFNIPVKDMYHESNINKQTKTQYMADDTHPNAKGYNIMGIKIGKFINSF